MGYVLTLLTQHSGMCVGFRAFYGICEGTDTEVNRQRGG